MAMVEEQETQARLAWLEHKIAQVLYFLVACVSTFVAWVIANAPIEDQRGWAWNAIFIVVWLSVGFILHRSAFKGAR
jgi:hypothetical protein